MCDYVKHVHLLKCSAEPLSDDLDPEAKTSTIDRHYKTSVSRNVTIFFRILAVMSKKRNAGSFRHMFSSFVYGVLVIPDNKNGS